MYVASINKYWFSSNLSESMTTHILIVLLAIEIGLGYIIWAFAQYNKLFGMIKELLLAGIKQGVSSLKLNSLIYSRLKTVSQCTELSNSEICNKIRGPWDRSKYIWYCQLRWLCNHYRVVRTIWLICSRWRFQMRFHEICWFMFQLCLFLTGYAIALHDPSVGPA